MPVACIPLDPHTQIKHKVEDVKDTVDVALHGAGNKGDRTVAKAKTEARAHTDVLHASRVTPLHIRERR